MPPLTADNVTMDDLDALERRLSRPDIERDLRGLKGWRRNLEEDTAFGRIMSGAQWVDGVSIVDGTVEGNVFRAQVTISNLFQTGETPADRWELDPSGLRAYGTVSGVPNTKTVDIHSTGDFELGAGASQITYVAATGVLTVPAAVIGALTIADVGSGVLGGTYQTASINPRVSLSTAGIVATNSGGTTTFNLQSSSGDFFMTGNFTIASSTSASNRIEIKQTGIELWKAGVREFHLQSGGVENDVQMLLTGASVGEYIGMQPDTGFWLGASTFAAAPFRVSNAGAVTMTSATITGGTLTSPSISSATITGTTITGQTIRTGASNPKVEMTASGVFVYNSGGTNTAALNNDGSGFAGTGGNFAWNTAGTLSVNGSALANGSVADSKIGSLTAAKITTGTLGAITITIGAGGKIIDADGSEWSSTGIILRSSGVFGDSIKWTVSGVDKGSVYADATSVNLQYPSGGRVSLTSTLSIIGEGGNAQLQAGIDGNLRGILPSTDGSDTFEIRDSGGQVQFTISSNGAFGSTDADATALGTYAGRIPWYIGGALRYVPYYNA